MRRSRVSQVSSSFARLREEPRPPRRIDRIGRGQTGGQERFAPVRFYRGHSLPGDRLAGIGIGGGDFAGRLRPRGNLPDEFGAEQAFAVIFENHGVELRQICAAG